MNAGIISLSPFIIQPRPQPVGWCHPHSGWIFPTSVSLIQKVPTDVFRDLSHGSCQYQTSQIKADIFTLSWVPCSETLRIQEETTSNILSVHLPPLQPQTQKYILTIYLSYLRGGGGFFLISNQQSYQENDQPLFSVSHNRILSRTLESIVPSHLAVCR